MSVLTDSININAQQFSVELTKSKKCEGAVYSLLVISSPSFQIFFVESSLTLLPLIRE